MPNNVRKKIKSAPKTLSVVIALTALFVLAGFMLFLPHRSNTAMLEVSGRAFYLQRADTPQLRAQGLSGRKMLKQDEGMLFEYGSMGTRCMWMKDMHVPIDIVWLDTAKRVTAMERRIFPSTFPQQFCHQGSYVIEIPIGSSHGITPGQQVQF